MAALTAVSWSPSYKAVIEPFFASPIADRGFRSMNASTFYDVFYRLESSRNSPGNGLGLSLVAAVANLHGAHIEMKDNSPGLRIELQFPIPEKAVSGFPHHEAGGHVGTMPNQASRR
jgi:hypothetical protein